MKIKQFIFEMALDSTNSEANNLVQNLKTRYNYDRIIASPDSLSDFAKSLGLNYLGYSNREVYGNDKFAVKFAFSKNGRNQNRKEVFAKDECLSDEYFTKIYGFDEENFNWIVAEKIKSGLTKEEVYQKLLDQIEGSSDDFVRDMYVLDAEEAIRLFEDTLTNPGDVELNPWAKKLSDEIIECNILPDFHEGNWGIRQNGDLILLDYGF